MCVCVCMYVVRMCVCVRGCMGEVKIIKLKATFSRGGGSKGLPLTCLPTRCEPAPPADDLNPGPVRIPPAWNGMEWRQEYHTRRRQNRIETDRTVE